MSSADAMHQLQTAPGGRPLKQFLGRVTGGAPFAPLGVLFGLNLVDELDRIAFGILAPEIGDTFDLGDGSMIALSALVSVFVLFAALPVAMLGDRRNRVRMATYAAIAWSTMSVLTGIAGATRMLAVLVIARLFAGVGRVINDPVHSSLLSDYYSAEVHPKVFAVHRFANAASSATSIGIGATALVLSWQLIFVLLALPTAVLIVAASRLREPLRGESIEPARAAAHLDDPPMSFATARRQLFAVRSLRRLYLTAFLMGFGIIPLGGFIAFFFDNVYGFSTFARGFTSFVFGAGSTAGLVIGARAASRIPAGSPGLARITGYSFIFGGVGLILMAIAPSPVLSVALLFVGGIGGGAFVPAYYPLVSAVAPAQIRSQAYGYSLILLGFGGLIGAVLVGSLGDSYGYRIGVAVTAAIVAGAGAVALTAARFVAHDKKRAEQFLERAVAEPRLDRS